MSVFIGYPSFMAYQMMKGKKGNNDDFPSIPGMIARYSALGLTNEQMAANPVWVDKTGNGHDLQLKNFSWKGMSGIGGYGDENYQTFYKFTLDDYVFIASPPGVKHMNFTFRVTGLQPGNKLTLAFFGTTNTVYGIWDKDGIYRSDYNIPQEDGKVIVGIGTVGFTGECNITIEQIPEYEGYLVTDGVDDKIVSSVFGMGKDFTIVGDWKFIDNKKSGTGLVKGSSFYIYNTMTGLDLYINSSSVKNSLDGIKSINAACSDGRAYDRNWNEILANTGNVVGSGGTLEVSSSGGRFDRIAFKNLAIYPRILSKDECVKAYNYLQTLKAK